jgi:hypothetical protein
MGNSKGKTSLTREAVLRQLDDLAEGRHPTCQTVTAKFMRSEEWKQASNILREAIQQESFRRGATDLPAPPGWLLPI